MSGIVGVWNLNGAPVERALLERLAATLAHRGPDVRGVWVDGPVGMAACLLRVTPESAREVQPVVQPGEAVCVFDGRLDNRDEILADTQSSAAITATSPDSALVLAAYRQYGEKFVEHLNGDFALAVFDIRRRTLFLARDYLGIRPLYYARAGDTFLFASEIKAILAYPDFPRVPNEEALAVFLAQGISQDASGQTLFSGVYNLPPAHVLTVTPDKNFARRYWSFENVSSPAAKSPEEYAEGFRWHFERAVRRRTRSAYPVAVMVSGGLDSSSVFCMAETLRRATPGAVPPIFGVTLTYPQASPADESEFIAAI
ncbi:MAG TPA: asparagine synthetase B, partial [Candidatus Acidoferrales bacterium]|nr:asparagine synthetase B [Candidatus Acidoferrales bacterium]